MLRGCPEGSVLRIGVSPVPQAVEPCILRPTKTKCRPGIELEILLTVASMLQCPVELVPNPDGGCGGVDASGNVTGLIRLLVEGKIDVTGNTCTYSEQRAKYVRSSPPVYFSKTAFTIKAKKPLFMLHVSAPFQNIVWAFCLGAVVVFIILGLMQICLDARWGPSASLTFDYVLLSAIFLFEYDLGRLRRLSARILFAAWMQAAGFMLLLYSTYVMAAALRKETPGPPFSDCRELSYLLESGKYVRISSALNPLPPVCGKEEVSRIAAATVKHGYVYTKAELRWERILEDERNVVYTAQEIFTEQDLSSIDAAKAADLWVVVDPNSPVNQIGFLWRKDFALAESVKLALHTLGDFKFTVRRRYIRRSSGGKDGKAESVMRALDMDQLLGMFQIMAVGMSASLGSFVCELLWKRYSVRNGTLVDQKDSRQWKGIEGISQGTEDAGVDQSPSPPQSIRPGLGLNRSAILRKDARRDRVVVQLFHLEGISNADTARLY